MAATANLFDTSKTPPEQLAIADNSPQKWSHAHPFIVLAQRSFMLWIMLPGRTPS